MAWIIISIICFFILLWMLTVPHVFNMDPRNHYSYQPYGIKIWSGILLVLASLIPIINIIAVLVMIIIVLVAAYENNVDWDDTFPNGSFLTKIKNLFNKLGNFLNKDLIKK